MALLTAAARRDPVLLIANPGARRASGLRATAIDAFRDAGVRCDVALTERPGHGAQLARARHADYAAVFALGGDGTAIEVLEALAYGPVPVGVLPGGTGNLVARSLGVPLRIGLAVPALLAGEEALIDLGVVAPAGAPEGSAEEHRFAFTVGVGIDARMIEATKPALKRRFGIAAYALTAAAATLRGERFRVTIDADGTAIERDGVSAVMVANFGAVLSDLLHLGPGIVCDDGKLDLCVFAPAGVVDAVHLAWRLFRKDFRPHPGLLYHPGARFRIDSTATQTVQADGEVRGRTPITVRVEPRAARVLRPSRRGRDGG